MSVRRSTENLAVTPPQTAQVVQPQALISANLDVCGICKNYISNKGNSTKTNCNHVFHKTCLSKSTQNKSTCPTCNAQITLTKFSKPNTSSATMATRSQSRPQSLDINRSTSDSIAGNIRSTTNTNTTQSSDSSPDAQRHMISLGNNIQNTIPAREATQNPVDFSENLNF